MRRICLNLTTKNWPGSRWDRQVGRWRSREVRWSVLAWRVSWDSCVAARTALRAAPVLPAAPLPVVGSVRHHSTQSLNSLPLSLPRVVKMWWSVSKINSTTLCLQKNDTDVTHYRFNPHQPISVIFGRDVAERVCYWMVIYYPTSPN